MDGIDAGDLLARHTLHVVRPIPKQGHRLGIEGNRILPYGQFHIATVDVPPLHDSLLPIIPPFHSSNIPITFTSFRG
jgi:hypothetical protein